MIKSYLYIIFDLDGTLTDSGPGIMNGFIYANKKMGRQKIEEEQLRRVVGPPLKDSFTRILGYSSQDTETAVGLYREYYNDMGGVFENQVYPGIDSLLSELRSAGKKLIVATSKSVNATKIVLKHFKLDQYFDFIAAADDKARPSKVDVLRYVFAQCGIIDMPKAVMIGDRENDITAAGEIGIDSIGVLYGYGNQEELVEAGATYLAESVSDLRNLIL